MPYSIGGVDKVFKHLIVSYLNPSRTLMVCLLNTPNLKVSDLIRLAGSPSDGRSSGRQIIFKQHLTGVITLTISEPLVL